MACYTVPIRDFIFDKWYNIIPGIVDSYACSLVEKLTLKMKP